MYSQEQWADSTFKGNSEFVFAPAGRRATMCGCTSRLNPKESTNLKDIVRSPRLLLILRRPTLFQTLRHPPGARDSSYASLKCRVTQAGLTG
jgi:hypothetical protein